MSQESLFYYLCPWCGTGDIVRYRYKSKWKHTYTDYYLGSCCKKYPKENKVVEEALKRLTLERQEIPKA